MQTGFKSTEVSGVRKMKYTVTIKPEALKAAIKQFNDITARPEYADIASGVHWSFSIEKGDEYGIFTIRSLFLHPSKENEERISKLIKEMGDSVLRVSDGNVNSVLRTSA
jgi:tRNA(Phe) wybutosine-synthesizing methylase Tyw3